MAIGGRQVGSLITGGWNGAARSRSELVPNDDLGADQDAETSRQIDSDCEPCGGDRPRMRRTTSFAPFTLLTIWAS